MGKIIAISSGKGGTGKTTSVAAISSCLAVLGHRTLCIDFDLGLNNLDLALCMADYSIADFMDVAEGKLSLTNACREHDQMRGLFFLSAPPTDAHIDLEMEALNLMFNEIKKTFDFCIIDTPAGTGNGFQLAHRYANMSIVVSTGDVTSIRDAQRSVEAVREHGNVKDIRLLVNRAHPSNFKFMQKSIDDIINTIGVRLIGVVSEDKAVFRAMHSGVPLVLFRKRLAAYDYLDVARRILGEDIPLAQASTRARLRQSGVFG